MDTIMIRIVIFHSVVMHFLLINMNEPERTSIIREMAVGHELSWFYAITQRSHSPRTAEEHVSSGAQRAQLLHAPLFRAPILKPHLHDTKYTNETGHSFPD